MSNQNTDRSDSNAVLNPTVESNHRTLIASFKHIDRMISLYGTTLFSDAALLKIYHRWLKLRYLHLNFSFN